MEKEMEIQWREYERILDSMDFREEELDYSILDYHIPRLKMLDVIETGAMYIIDLYKRDYQYFSQRFYSMFGYDVEEALKEGPSFLDNKLHPDDRLMILKAGNYYMKFALALPLEKRRSGKLIVDYRIQNGGGEYVRVIKQHLPLEFDKRGNIWLSLCTLDISPDHDLDSPFRARAVDFNTGEIYQFLPENLDAEKELLSDREKQILNLIAEGMHSREIAEKLFISVNTVNTHRQRIIEKLNVSNSAEAVKYATKIKII